MTATTPPLETARRRAFDTRPLALAALIGLAVCAALADLALGPVSIPLRDVIGAFAGAGDPATDPIVLHIRAPRVALGLAAGVALALSGAVLQGMLRNPLADPGLIGVTGGASLGAVLVIVLGDLLLPEALAAVRPFALPFMAFVGAGAVTAFIFLVARRGGATSVATLILAGVAVNAIAGAAIGALVYVSNDTQLRNLMFWTMGSLGGAGWVLVGIALAITLPVAVLLMRLERALDLFQLGERAAFHAGLAVERAKLAAGLLVALGVGCVTAAAGPIGFIGLVAPHMARLIIGPEHRWLLPASAALGAALLLLADLGVRLAVPPAEPPIGLATSLIGGPFFLWLLLTRIRREGGGA